MNKNFNTDINELPKANLSENAMWLLEQRYFVKRGKGKESTFEELVRRVSRTVASAETNYSDSLEWIRTLEKNIANDMLNRRFLFNSPCLFSSGAGLTELDELLYKEPDKMSLQDYVTLHKSKTKNQQLFACFVIGIQDSIEGIFDSVKNAGIISKFGGGVGGNFGNLRERSSYCGGYRRNSIRASVIHGNMEHNGSCCCSRRKKACCTHGYALR